MEALNQILPAAWSHNNPIDVIGDASPERYAKAVEIAAKDPNSDGLLVVLTPQAMTDPTQTAEHLKPYAKLEGKPILASWMGGAEVAAGIGILNQARIPTFQFPDTAVRAFAYMWKWAYNLKGLYETPSLPEDSAEYAPNKTLTSEIIQNARYGRPHHPHRSRIEAGAGRLLHSHGAHGSRAHHGRGRRPGRAHGISGSSQVVLRNHHPQDRRGRRAIESCEAARP